MTSISNKPSVNVYEPTIQNQATDEASAAEGAAQSTGVGQVQGTTAAGEVTDIVEAGSSTTSATSGPGSTPPLLPPGEGSGSAGEQAVILADNYEQAMSPLVQQNSDGTASIENLSVDELMKMFMALNIMDPLDSNETKNNLTEAKGSLKQVAIEQIKKEIEAIKDKIEELEKKKGMFEALSVMFLIINPAGLLFKTLGDQHEALGIIGGVLAPEQMFLDMFGTSKNAGDLEEAKMELQLAEDRLGRVSRMEDVILGGGVAKKQQEEFERIWDMKLETANVGEDGVPLKTVASQLKGKLGKVMEALQSMMAEMGPQAAMAQAPQMLKDACLEVLQELGVKNAEELSEQMGQLLMLQLVQQVVTGGASAEQAMGPATLVLGEALDPESTLDKDSNDTPLFLGSAYEDAIKAIRSFAQLHAASNEGQQTFIS